MTPANQHPSPRRRILVAVDASRQARETMEAAAELALRWSAELTALFVEDADLLRLAALPFAAEVGADTETRPLDAARLERHLRADVRTVREACERLEREKKVRTRVEVVRGSVVHEILLASEHAELVVLGRAAGATTRRRAPLGRTTRSVLAASARPVAVMGAARTGVAGANGGVARPVGVVLDGREASRRALDLAIRLAGEDHRNLVVFLAPSPDAGAADLGAAAVAAARPLGIEPRLVTLAGGGAALEPAVHREGCRALVVDRECPLLSPDGVLGLAERLHLPLFAC